MEIEKIEKKKSEAFILKVKNVTDDKIYNLNLLENLDQRVSINYGIDGISLDDFRELIKSQITTIGVVKFKAFYEFKKFVEKQLECSFTIDFTDKKGNKSKKIVRLMTDPYQYDPTQITTHDSFVMTNIDGCNTSLILEYLMPEMELFIYLYPMSIEK
jgi:hypothetical protein